MNLITGGFGFIGSYVCQELSERGERFIVFDKRTYAAVNYDFVRSLPGFSGAIVGDICDDSSWSRVPLIEDFQGEISCVYHLAAETHVDRSIGLEPTTLQDGEENSSPFEFLRTNVEGTANVARFCSMRRVPLLHFSTDEVYGDASKYVEGEWVDFVQMLREDREGWDGLVVACSEDTPFEGSSPYAASKVGAEFVLRSFHRTFGLDYRIVRPSNAYGARQSPDKLIGVSIRKLSTGQKVPLYDGGYQVRQWVHAADIATGAIDIMNRGTSGTAYNLGGLDIYRNADIVSILANTVRKSGGVPEVPFVSVRDRPGHDLLYAVDSQLVYESVGWLPSRSFDGEVEDLVSAYRL